MREVIKTGRTVEDATELALAELGVSAEEAGIEVLELPQRRLFKSIPAKVRAYVEDEEVPEAPAPKEEKPLPKAAPKWWNMSWMRPRLFPGCAWTICTASSAI